MKHTQLDSIDLKILMELSKDARLPFAELGRRIGLSPSAANDRVRQLESLQIIQGYHATLREVMPFCSRSFCPRRRRSKA